MSDKQDNKSWLIRWLENIVPTTRIGQAMLVGIVVWFFNWIFSDGRVIFGSPVLKLVLDLASVLALIPLIYFLVKGVRGGMRRSLWRLRRRLIVTYCLIGALPMFLLILLVAAIGYSVLLQSSSDLVARQLDGYLEQSSTAAQAISRELSSEDLSRVDLAQLRQRLQNRASALSSVFPGLTLTLRGNSPQPFEISVTSSESETSDRDRSALSRATQVWNTAAPLPEWMKSKESFDGLVFDEDAMGNLHIFARHVIKSAVPTPLMLQLSYPIGAELSQHLSHTTGLGVAPGQATLRVRRLPNGEPYLDPPNQPPNGFPILMPTTDWQSGEQMQSDVLLVDISLLGLDQTLSRLNQFRSNSFIGESLLVIITSLGGIFLVLAVVAIVWAGFLTRSITGAVHDLYEGTKRIEAGDLEHEIPKRGQDQLSALTVSFNQMTRSVRELLRVSAEKQRLDQEMRIAAEVQARLFPRAIPPTATLDMAPGICLPARAVSGDYYDFLEVASSVIGVVVADVCGKGMSAALLMANLQANLRGQVQAYRDAYQFRLSAAAATADSDNHSSTSGTALTTYADPPAPSHSVQALVERVNRQIESSILDASYITLFYAEFNEQTSMLHYTNAGHNPPLLLRRGSDGRTGVERLDCGGTVLGLFADAPYEEAALRLESGDLLVAFTDGLIEARNPQGEEFGEERLTPLLARSAHLPAVEIERLILQTVKNWTGGADQEDDLTLVIFKVK